MAKTRQPELKIKVSAKSIFSESIKTIRTNLSFMKGNQANKTILFTSPESGDGKSFIVANLAIAFAQEGKKVLIIDCDLRRGRQKEIFEIDCDQNKGYSMAILHYTPDYKLGSHIFKFKSQEGSVSVLPKGITPPNPIELLGSAKNEAIIEELKEKYDIILLDCPPAVGLSDAIIMTKFSDINVAVISSKKTKMELLQRTKKNFEQAGAKIDGVVMNKVSLSDKSVYLKNSYYGE